jgi:hypothetical protein
MLWIPCVERVKFQKSNIISVLLGATIIVNDECAFTRGDLNQINAFID